MRPRAPTGRSSRIQNRAPCGTSTNFASVQIRQLESRVPALEAAAAAESLGSPNPPVQTPTGRVIPEAFKCPLTKKVMTNPVICANGHTYERKTLVKWYRMFQTLPTVRRAVLCGGGEVR